MAGPIDRVAAGWLGELCTVVIYMVHHSNFVVLWAPKVLQQGLEHRKAQPRREHLAPHDETHGSCHDLALHGHGAGTTARRCKCSLTEPLSKNRPVAHQALHLQYCDSCIDGDHVSMLRCGARGAASSTAAVRGADMVPVLGRVASGMRQVARAELQQDLDSPQTRRRSVRR